MIEGYERLFLYLIYLVRLFCFLDIMRSDNHRDTFLFCDLYQVVPNTVQKVFVYVIVPTLSLKKMEGNESILACPLKLDLNRQWVHRGSAVQASEAELLRRIFFFAGHRSCSSPNDPWVAVGVNPLILCIFLLKIIFSISLT